MSEVSRVSFCPFLLFLPALVCGWRVAPLWRVALL